MPDIDHTTGHPPAPSRLLVYDNMTGDDKSLENYAPIHNAPYTDKPPPPFGHPLLKYFCFEPGHVNVNNGPLIIHSRSLTDNLH